MNTEQRALLEAAAHLQGGFAEAVRRMGSHHCSFQVAGRHLNLYTAGPALLPDLTDALEPLACTPRDSADVTVYAWDSASTGVAPVCSLLPGTYVAHSSHLHVVVQESTGAIQLYDAAQRVGYLWQAEAGATSTYSAPLRELLANALAAHGLTGLHAAAVGTPDGGALLIGHGGVGKSTTAMACALAGMSFVAEDFCLVAVRPAPVAHLLYSSARLLPSSLQWVAPPTTTVTARTADGKQVYLLHRAADITLAASMPIHAILLLRIGNGTATRVTRATEAEVLTTLAPVSVRMMGLPLSASAAAVREMAMLARAVDCYRVELGQDVAALPAMLQETIEAATQRREALLD